MSDFGNILFKGSVVGKLIHLHFELRAIEYLLLFSISDQRFSRFSKTIHSYRIAKMLQFYTKIKHRESPKCDAITKSLFTDANCIDCDIYSVCIYSP